MSGSKEFYSTIKGKKEDAHLHEPILDNANADRYMAREAIRRAVAKGMDLKTAKKIYNPE